MEAHRPVERSSAANQRDGAGPAPTGAPPPADSAEPPARPAAARRRVLGRTLLGLVVGVVTGYPVGATAGMLLVGPLVGLGLLRSETGGWYESNIVGGILWLAAAGAVVGLCQQWPRRRSAAWWVLGSAVLWGLIALASLGGEGRLRAVDLRVALPLATLSSLAAAFVLRAAARGRRALPTP